MKHAKWLLLLCALHFSLFATAQDDHALPIVPVSIYGGAKIGLNLAKINSDTWDDGFKANAQGGLFLGVHRAHIGAQVEVIFSQSTYKTGTSFSSLPSAYFNDAKDSAKGGSFHVNYVSIPLLFQLKLASSVWLQLGPQYSGILSVSDKDDLLKDAKSLFKSGELDGIAGLQLSIGKHIVASGRYVFGLNNVNNVSEVKNSWKQSNVQFALGFSL